MMAHISLRYAIENVPSEVFSVRFSSDGLLLATGCNDGVVRVYNGKTGAPLHALRTAAVASAVAGPGVAGGIRTKASNSSGTNAGTFASGYSDASNDPVTLSAGAHASQDFADYSLELPSMPITSLRFRPPTAASTTRSILLACGADGSARHWHVTSGKCLATIMEKDNQIFACDYRSDGLAFATAGKDKIVRVYDAEAGVNQGSGSAIAGASSPTTSSTSSAASYGLTGAMAMSAPSHKMGRSAYSMEEGGGHSNRVFAVTFHPTQQPILLSGGWDNTIQIYDTRAGSAVRSLYGAHICGDALSVTPDGRYVVSGSWRPDDALQLWDFATGKLVVSMPWLRSNTEVQPYLRSVWEAHHPPQYYSNTGNQQSHPHGVHVHADGQPHSHQADDVEYAASSSSDAATGGKKKQPPSAYSKPDPCMLYTVSISRGLTGNSTSSADNNSTGTLTQDDGPFLFAGGSGVNGGKVWRIADLITMGGDIETAAAATTSSSSGAPQTQPPQSSPTTAPVTAPQPPISTARPLVATIAGLPRGVYGSDWDCSTSSSSSSNISTGAAAGGRPSAGGLVIVGGDQPIRVFDLQLKPALQQAQQAEGDVAAGVAVAIAAPGRKQKQGSKLRSRLPLSHKAATTAAPAELATGSAGASTVSKPIIVHDATPLPDSVARDGGYPGPGPRPVDGADVVAGGDEDAIADEFGADDEVEDEDGDEFGDDNDAGTFDAGWLPPSEAAASTSAGSSTSGRPQRPMSAGRLGLGSAQAAAAAASKTSGHISPTAGGATGRRTSGTVSSLRAAILEARAAQQQSSTSPVPTFEEQQASQSSMPRSAADEAAIVSEYGGEEEEEEEVGDEGDD